MSSIREDIPHAQPTNGDPEINFTFEDLISELSLNVLAQIAPDEITAGMFAEKCGITKDTAARILNRKLDAHEYTRRWVRNPDGGGGRIYAYRKARDHAIIKDVA